MGVCGVLWGASRAVSTGPSLVLCWEHLCIQGEPWDLAGRGQGLSFCPRVIPEAFQVSSHRPFLTLFFIL